MQRPEHEAGAGGAAGGTAAEIRDLITAIEQAFAGVRRGAVTLHEAEVMDSYGTAAERLAARDLDPEQDWRDVSAASLHACSAALSFVDPVSWRFYLPAVMRLGLQQLQLRGDAMDRAIYTLDSGGAPGLHAYNAARFRTLNEAQAQVVRRFLAFAARHDDHCDGVVAGQALARHWDADPRSRG